MMTSAATSVTVHEGNLSAGNITSATCITAQATTR